MEHHACNGFHGLPYERCPRIEVQTCRELLVYSAEIQIKDGCHALHAAREATLTFRMETLAQCCKKLGVLELWSEERCRWKLQIVVGKECPGGVVLMSQKP